MESRIWRHFDFALLSATFALIAFGLAMIYSATYGTEPGATVDPRVVRQIAYAAAGIGVMVLMVGFDYRLLSNLAGLLYAGAVAALVVVLVLGRLHYGAVRWIDLGFFQLQPSEPAKLLVAVALARYFAVNRERIHRLRTILTSLAIAGLPFFLTLVQPDLGTALVFMAIWFGTAYAAGIRWRHIGLLAAVGALLMPIGWQMVPGYMRARIQIFIDPYSDPLDKGYNIIQATISVGSGGWLGRGFLSGTQSQLHFLRVQYADFIFSVLAEELGFVGAVALFALFTVLVLRGLRSAYLASEPFGRLLAVAIVSMVMFQVFVNVGMNISLLPVTGIPLPFISFGGSSLLTFMAAVGILESITMRHRKFEF
ncbi:MAG TPA: rod shape-determining protein RodA [Chloroflexota bacterium]